MKRTNSVGRAIAFVFAALLIVFGSFGVLAVGEDGGEPDYGYNDQQGENLGDQDDNQYPDPYDDGQSSGLPPEIITEPYAEPETQPIATEPPTEYVEPAQETTEAFTEWQQTTEAAGYNDYYIEPTEFFEPPTVPKTISVKTYSTNYTAGIVSWLCVAVGAVVMITTVVSTKMGGARN